MASYNGNIDLLALNGAKVLVGIDEKNAQRPYVCIPIDVNEIRVDTSKNDASKTQAKLRVNICLSMRRIRIRFARVQPSVAIPK